MWHEFPLTGYELRSPINGKDLPNQIPAARPNRLSKRVTPFVYEGIKSTSAGPILFAQKRLGRDGKSFMLYKFRTMHPNAEELLKANPSLYEKDRTNNFKVPKGEDPRVNKTRCGP